MPNLRTDHVFIIAEAGVNHNGNLDLAKKMIDAARAAEVDAVKFQTFVADELVLDNLPPEHYQQKSAPGKTQLEMLKEYELSREETVILKRHAEEQGLIFLSTPFERTSADFLESIGVRLFKLASDEVTNFYLLNHVARKRVPIILSTGMATLQEVRNAVVQVTRYHDKLSLLHCTSSYPAPYGELNLRAMLTLQREFPFPIGYSDHSLGLHVPISAVALGARILEKHFTLDRTLKGPDQSSSLEPNELKELVRQIRQIETALGSGEKRPTDSEQEARAMSRRSLIAKRNIGVGETITEDMVCAKRPGHGISACYFDQVVGNRVTRSIAANSMIQDADLLHHVGVTR